MTAIMQRIADTLLGAPRLFAALLVILFLVSEVGVVQLKFDDGTRATFASARPEYQRYLDHVEQFEQSDTMAILHISSDRSFDAQSLPHLRDLGFRLQQQDGIEAVFSVFGVNSTNPELGDIVSATGAELAALQSIQPQTPTAMTATGAARTMISDNRRETVLVLALDLETQNVEQAAPTLERVREIMAEAEASSGFSISMSGMVPIREAIIQGTMRDQLFVNAIGGLFGFLAALLVFRNLWIALVNTIAPIVALTLTLGFFGWFGFEINVVRNTLPVLILVLATADCIHMTFGFCRKSCEGADLSTAIREMLVEIGPPCVLTSLTTMLAFASLSFSQSPLIQSLSLSGVIAIALSLLTVLVFHPLVLIIAWKIRTARESFQRTRGRFLPLVWMQSLIESTARFNRRTTAVSVVIGIVLLTLFLPIQTNFRFYEYIYPDDPLFETLDRAEAIAGPTQSIDVPLRLAPGFDPLSDRVLDDVAEVHGALENAFPDSNTVSIETVRRTLEAQGEFATGSNLTLMFSPLPERVRATLIARDDSAHLVRIFIEESGSGEISAMAQRAEQIAVGMNVETLSADRATGLYVMAASLSDVMIRQLAISFLIAAFACPVLIGLWFRRWQYGVAALLPNSLPIIAVGAWLSLIGTDLQFTSALALTIAFGIAVDDTIHVLNRIAIIEREGEMQGRLAVIGAAMHHVSPALVATTLILSMGVFSTFFSSMPTIWYFGQLAIAVFVLALVTVLFVLPAVLAFLPGRESETADETGLAPAE